VGSWWKGVRRLGRMRMGTVEAGRIEKYVEVVV